MNAYVANDQTTVTINGFAIDFDVGHMSVSPSLQVLFVNIKAGPLMENSIISVNGVKYVRDQSGQVTK